MLARDRKASFLLMIVGGLTFGLAIGLVAGLVAGLAAGVASGAVGAVAGGWAASTNGTVWLSYLRTKGWLALRRRLPWKLMGFLADAHRRGVLRQAGAVYQFRHIELQHRLATRDVDEGRSSMARGSKGAPDSRFFSV